MEGSLAKVVLLVGETKSVLVFEPAANVNEVFELDAAATRATTSIVVPDATFGVCSV